MRILSASARSTFSMVRTRAGPRPLLRRSSRIQPEDETDASRTTSRIHDLSSLPRSPAHHFWPGARALQRFRKTTDVKAALRFDLFADWPFAARCKPGFRGHPPGSHTFSAVSTNFIIVSGVSSRSRSGPSPSGALVCGLLVRSRSSESRRASGRITFNPVRSSHSQRLYRVNIDDALYSPALHRLDGRAKL